MIKFVEYPLFIILIGLPNEIILRDTIFRKSFNSSHSTEQYVVEVKSNAYLVYLYDRLGSKQRIFRPKIGPSIRQIKTPSHASIRHKEVNSDIKTHLLAPAWLLTMEGNTEYPYSTFNSPLQIAVNSNALLFPIPKQYLPSASTMRQTSKRKNSVPREWMKRLDTALQKRLLKWLLWRNVFKDS